MQDTAPNDYAVAKALNKYAIDILNIFSDYQLIGPLEEFDNREINKAYVLLVNELQELYNRTPKLFSIKYEPIWKQVDYIHSAYGMQKYLEKYDWKPSIKHNAEVDRLFILTGEKILDYSPEQQEVVDAVDAVISKYSELFFRQVKQLKDKSKRDKKDEEGPPPRWWYIPEYSLTYKPDGSILINDVLRLKRVHAGSTTERLLEQALKHPNELFKPDLGKTARNLSTVLSSAGFTSTLRELFFPAISQYNGVIFRPSITHSEVLAERINTYDLDAELAKLSAHIDVRPEEELIALGLAAPDEEDEDDKEYYGL